MADADTDAAARLDEVLDRIGRYPFRAKFHLRDAERRQVVLRGMRVIRMHATEIVGKRLAPVRPANDGKQTPWGGHPVFRAQHATGTCCRGCLARIHGVPAGRELTDAQRDHVVAVICRWIERECSSPRPDARHRLRPDARGPLRPHVSGAEHPESSRSAPPDVADGGRDQGVPTLF